jgi:anaphase-promoting complex subunit 5
MVSRKLRIWIVRWVLGFVEVGNHFFVLQACDGYLEPTLEELGQQLREAMPDVGGMLVEQLGSHLLLVSSPEELFQFFFSIRGKSIEVCNMKNSSSHVTLFDSIRNAPFGFFPWKALRCLIPFKFSGLAELLHPTPEGSEGHDEHFLVEQNSLPGQFLRRCILSFNLLSFEGTCRLVTELDAYHRPALTIARGIPSDKELAVGKLSDREDEGEDGLEDENLQWGGANLEHKLSALPGSVSRRDPTRRIFG